MRALEGDGAGSSRGGGANGGRQKGTVWRYLAPLGRRMRWGGERLGCFGETAGGRNCDQRQLRQLSQLAGGSWAPGDLGTWGPGDLAKGRAEGCARQESG